MKLFDPFLSQIMFLNGGNQLSEELYCSVDWAVRIWINWDSLNFWILGGVNRKICKENKEIPYIINNKLFEKPESRGWIIEGSWRGIKRLTRKCFLPIPLFPLCTAVPLLLLVMTIWPGPVRPATPSLFGEGPILPVHGAGWGGSRSGCRPALWCPAPPLFIYYYKIKINLLYIIVQYNCIY